MGMFGQGQFVCQFQGQPLESPDVRASREQGPPSRVPLKTAKGLSCQSVPRPHRQRDSAVSPLARAARYSPRLAPGRWGRLRRLQRFAQKLLGVSRAVSSPQVGPDFERGLLCFLPFSLLLRANQRRPRMRVRRSPLDFGMCSARNRPEPLPSRK